MHKRHKRRLSGIAFCFLMISTLFSETNHTISDELFKYFSQKNVSINVEYLNYSKSDQFPYNIILYNDNNENREISAPQSNIFFILSQKYARDNTNTVSALVKEGNVVLCANDDSALPLELRHESYPGLSTFLQSAPEDAIIILISEDSDLDAHEMQIIPGGNGLIASGSVIKALMHAGQLTDFSAGIQSVLLTFYRLRWVDGSKEAAFCLENGFQAAGLVISDKTASPQIEQFAHEMCSILNEEDITDGMQYSIITTGSQVISIPENLYTTILFFIIGVSLLANCLFSFMFGKQKTENRTIFLKWWYTGPLLVLLSFAITFLAKTLVLSLFANYQLHPLFALILKISFIFVIFLMLCELRYVIPFAETDYLYAFFMTLAAALDVFIFTSADMPLLLPFSLFYIIILISRPIKKWWINLIIFIILAFPLIYSLINAIPYLRDDIFISFTASPLILDFFTGALLLPYLLMTVRIFIQSGLWDRNKGTKRILIESSVLIACFCLLMVIAANCFTDVTVTDASSSDINSNSYDDIFLSEDAVYIDANSNFANGMLYFELSLSSDADVLRYDISVSSEAEVPLYSANLPFSFTDSSGHAVFNLDEYPANPFTVTGTAPDTLPFEMMITAWISDGTKLMREEHTISFIQNQHKKTQPEILIK